MTKLPSLPPRVVDGHKGTFGTVCVLGGQAAGPRVMIGGPAFAASAALRSGAGLAVLAVPAPIMAAALVIAPGATGLALPVNERRELRPSAAAELLDEYAAQHDCLAVGPGWGVGLPQQQIIVRLLAQATMPVVVDADAINALASLPDFASDINGEAVFTPHPGEYRRLAEALGLDADPVGPGPRADAAEQLARRLGSIVVLKGVGTVVTDGITTHCNDTGNAALATAGTGDVLTGMIAGFIAQFFRSDRAALSLLDCTRLAVWAHGRAADRWASRHGSAGLDARQLLDELPQVLAEMR